jgi:chromate reductase
MTTHNILGISGSFRAKSYNQYALAAAGQVMPAGMQLQMADYTDIPLFNQDLLAAGLPAPVERLRAQMAAADAVLIASPEYNFSVAGVLKNAIDWLSRTAPQPFKDKPVAILSATMGPLGGARSQYDLRKILGGLDAIVMPKPEVFIGMAQNRFDANGTLTDEATRKMLTDQMTALQAWIARVSS